MQHYLMAIVIISSGGALAWLTGKLRTMSAVIATVSCLAGGALALMTALQSLLNGNSTTSYILNLPLGQATLKIDQVSAFFSLPVIFLGTLAAVYAASTCHRDKYEGGGYWFFYNLLIASMLLLLASGNAILFLMAWEIMSLAAFFLITHRDEIASARNAGWRFFVASHIGTAGLFVLFALLSSSSGSYEFSQFAHAPITFGSASIIFFLALFGFGVKVGLLPLHVWLPDSYTFADAHVSAVLSGAMSKMGFYGLIRVLMFLPKPEESWGWAMAIGGLLTGIFALITALAQHDLKKVISYSSMENAGIILMALGCAVLANIWKQPAMAFAATAGALMHILNHAVCKGLLFLGSGAVYFGTGTRKLEAMGGLAKSMPYTAVAFGIGSAAISGLPPFNNFVSEFLIFLAGLKAATLGNSSALLLAGIILAGLGLIGGLAVACFARTFGLVFLGASRSDKKIEPLEIQPLVRIPLAILVFLIFATSLLSPWILLPVTRVAADIGSASGMLFSPDDVLASAMPMHAIAIFSLALLALVMVSYLIKMK
ncbi:MAG: proton-conducting transporter membrane subunit, partial [Candidatus Riflebacteria bacterium]|nr:proton-conducting transporter membrane subunit [Candidatus Riflebacteria bacterium]